MKKIQPSLLVALLLTAPAILAPTPLFAEAATAPAVAAPLAECAVPTATAVGAEATEAPFLAGAPGDAEGPDLGDPEEPLFAGVPCNERRCRATEFCCNFSCSICASIFNGSCTQQFCPIRP